MEEGAGEAGERRCGCRDGQRDAALLVVNMEEERHESRDGLALAAGNGGTRGPAPRAPTFNAAQPTPWF